ncbi:uncharacterized protein [Rhodnius prolixus]|uniref:uncharacterized protein n=1 Tax=Rhodnius prolixus TaxID=13249 RepID=UPI003D18BEA1
MLPAKLYINGSPSKKDVKLQFINKRWLRIYKKRILLTSDFTRDSREKNVITGRTQQQKYIRLGSHTPLLHFDSASQLGRFRQFSVTFSTLKLINTGDTKSTACKLSINGRPSDKDVKHQSNVNVSTNIG